MHWSCPHCGISLAIAESALGTGWSFSRCYKCGGFALIRKAEINIIKVDKAPPGEKIILPEASVDPTVNLMSTKATQKFEKYVNKSAATPTALPSVIQPLPLLQKTVPGIHSEIDLSPFPAIEKKKSKSLFFPIGISLTVLVMAISGIYLYLQAQTLWDKTHEAAVKNTASAELPTVHSTVETPAVSKNLSQSDIIDQVQKSAMAPVKPDQINPLSQNSPSDDSEVTPTPPASPKLMVRIRAKKANLHSGPGLQFPVIGLAMANKNYEVTEWNNQWFKLLVSKPTGSAVTMAWIRNDLVQVLPHP